MKLRLPRAPRNRRVLVICLVIGVVSVLILNSLRRTGAPPSAYLLESVPSTCDRVTATVGRAGRRRASRELAWSWRRDDEAREMVVTAPGDVETRLEYDIPVEQADSITPDGNQRVFERDVAGCLLQARAGDHVRTFRYYNTGALAKSEAEGAPTLWYTYDTQDRPEEVHIGDTEIRYEYDYLGRLSAIVTPVGSIAYSYLLGANTVIRRLPNGVQTFREYDDEGRLTKLTHADAKDLIIAEYGYTYRPDGLIGKVTEGSQRHGERTFAYKYDLMHRLREVQCSDAKASHAYGYDALGNLAESGSPVGGKPLRLKNTPGGALASDSRGPVQVDARGHIRSLPHAPDAIDYEFGAHGELVAANNDSVTYQYDAQGMLVCRTVKGRETRYLPNPFSDAWLPLWTCAPGGDEAVLVWDRGMPLVELRGREVRYRLEDHLGSVRVVLNRKGADIAWHDYAPYGTPVAAEPEAKAGTDIVPRFAGLFWDPVAKVYLTAARAYDPVTARFLQPDPVVRVPGASKHSHSLYAYCGGDPVNFIDIDGCSPRTAREIARDWELRNLSRNYEDQQYLLTSSAIVDDLASRATEDAIKEGVSSVVPPLKYLLDPIETAKLHNSLQLQTIKWAMESNLRLASPDMRGVFASTYAQGYRTASAGVTVFNGGLAALGHAKTFLDQVRLRARAFQAIDPPRYLDHQTLRGWHGQGRYQTSKGVMCYREQQTANVLRDAPITRFHEEGIYNSGFRYHQTRTTEVGGLSSWDKFLEYVFPRETLYGPSIRKTTRTSVSYREIKKGLGVIDPNTGMSEFGQNPRTTHSFGGSRSDPMGGGGGRPPGPPAGSGSGGDLGADRRREGNVTVYVMDRPLVVPVGPVNIPFPRNYHGPVCHKQFFWQDSSGTWNSRGLLTRNEYGATPQKYDFGHDFDNLHIYSDNVKSYTVNEDTFYMAMTKVESDYRQPGHEYDFGGTWGHLRSKQPNCQDYTVDVINETYRQTSSPAADDWNTSRFLQSVAQAGTGTLGPGAAFWQNRETHQWLRQVLPSVEPKPNIVDPRTRTESATPTFDRDHGIGSSVVEQATRRGAMPPLPPRGGMGALPSVNHLAGVRGGVGVPSPVGGVYLGGAGKALEGLGRLKGVALDAANGKLVLIGAGDAAVGLPPLYLDDVVTVFREVYDHGVSPSVTIDPDEGNPTGPIMHVKHGPGTTNTYVGWVLFECDRVMKAYQLGKDNVSGLDVSSKVAGYADTLDKVFFGDETHEGEASSLLGRLFGRGTSSKQRWERFWIVPAAVNRFDAPVNRLSLFDVPLKVNTQKMRWKKGKLVDDEKGDSSAGAKAFTAWFTKHYDAIADEVLLEPPAGSGRKGPVAIFRELRRVALIAAIAERLRDLGEPLPLWMRDHVVAPCQVTNTTPSLTVEKRRDDGSVVRTATIFGGVNLAPADKDVRTYGRHNRAPARGAPPEAKVFVGKCEQETTLLTKRMPELTRYATARTDGACKIAGADGMQIAAAVLPGAKTRALAPNRQRVTDVVVPLGLGRTLSLTRHYNSFFDPAGEFGKGWTLDLPKLHRVKIPAKRDGKRSRFRSGYHLVSPLGTMNVFFNQVEKVEPCGVEMAVAVGHPEIAGVGEGNSDLLRQGTHQVLFRDGTKWHFDDSGRLVLSQADGTATRYIRDDGRLVGIQGYVGKRRVAVIRLAYDDHDRLASVEVVQAEHLRAQVPASISTIRYEYDIGSRLATVSSSETAAHTATEHQLSYGYENGKLSSIRGSGDDLGFGYNGRGQLLWKKRGERKHVYNVEATSGGFAFMEQSPEAGSPVRAQVYDASMRPTHADMGNEVTADWTYGEGAEVKQTLSRQGEPILTKCVGSDGLTTTTAWTDGPTFELRRDPLGRPVSVSRNGANAVEMEWPDAGPPVCMRAAGSEIRPRRHEDGWSNGVLISAPMKRGKTDQWTEMKWDQVGRLCGVTDSSGLEFTARHNGHGQISSFIRKANDGTAVTTQCAYDDQQRLVDVNAPWGQVKWEYAADGMVSRIVAEKDGARSESVFDRYGRITRRRAFDGGMTRWHYGSAGEGHAVRKIELPNGETIEYASAGAGNGGSVHVGHAVVSAERGDEGRTSRVIWRGR